MIMIYIFEVDLLIRRFSPGEREETVIARFNVLPVGRALCLLSRDKFSSINLCRQIEQR